MRGASQTWPYRPGLHVLVRAPDGTLAATTIIWLDERNGTAEFEPVGTHQGYRRLGLARSLLQHGMQRAAQAGATEMLVACLRRPGAHRRTGAVLRRRVPPVHPRPPPHVKPRAGYRPRAAIYAGASSLLDESSPAAG